MVAKLFARIRDYFCRKPACKITSPDREQMKFASEPEKKKVSIASHAQSNAAMKNSASSQEMRRSSDAIADLARGWNR